MDEGITDYGLYIAGLGGTAWITDDGLCRQDLGGTA